MEKLTIFNELSEHIMIRVNSCGEKEHPNWWIESKTHQDYDLWYIYEGDIEIRINEQIYHASKGDLVLFCPKVSYTATTNQYGCRFNFTHFEFGLGNHFGILDNFKLSGIIKNAFVREEIQLFLKSYEQYKIGIPMSGIRLKGFLTVLISKIIELYGRREYRGEFTRQASHTKRTMNLQTLQPTLDFIHNHLHQSLLNRDLAKMMGMSEKYFIVYFKKALGITPREYIYQLKMNRARELLLGEQYAIQQIADMLGYADPYSFSKAFKKHYKVPPSQFV